MALEIMLWRKLPFVWALAAMLWAPPLQGDRILLKGGETREAAVLGRLRGELWAVSFDKTAWRLPLEQIESIGPTPLPSDCEKAYHKALGRFLEEVEDESQSLVRRYSKSSDPDREAIEASLVDLDIRGSLQPLRKALERDARTESLALRVLLRPDPATGQIADAAMWSVVEASLTTDDKPRAARLRDAAVAASPEGSRRAFEAVVLGELPLRIRARAVAFLAELGDQGSIPTLIDALDQSGLAIRARRSRGELRPAEGGGGIQLPRQSSTSLGASDAASEEALREFSTLLIRALQQLSGQDCGDDTSAWRRWWDSNARPRGP